MKKVIGALMLSIIPIGITAQVVSANGWMAALYLWVGVAVICGLSIGGVYLLVSEE